MKFCCSRARVRAACLLSLFSLLIPIATRAQGPSPESAAPLFPGGTLLSYNSTFTTRGLAASNSSLIPVTARPTLSHEGDFHFTWGFFPNFDVEAVVPIVTNQFHFANRAANPGASGTGLGDAMLIVKCRFYRKDSKRGTTQASITFGPKLPTGRTDLTDPSGTLLPAGLQAGSGSTDFILGANWTYTGVFNIRRLVADEDFGSLLRTTGTQRARLGDEMKSRFWLSYRPYESKYATRDWFIGPDLTWLYSQNDRLKNVEQPGSGGEALLAGIATYVDARPGMDVWVGIDWDIAHTSGAAYMPVRRYISFGITQQFRLHL